MSETTDFHPREEGSALRISPPALAGLLLAGLLLLHLLGGGRHRFVHPHELLGMLTVAAGVGLASYAAALFGARATTRDPHGEPTAFITEGPYAFTRNPMYLGLAAGLVGFALFFGSPAMLLAPVLFYLAIDRMLIPHEEATMERVFGDQYVDYKRRVQRWL